MNASVLIWKSFGGLSAEVFLAADAFGWRLRVQELLAKKDFPFLQIREKKILLSCRKADNFHENLDRRKKKIGVSVNE